MNTSDSEDVDKASLKMQHFTILTKFFSTKLIFNPNSILFCKTSKDLKIFIEKLDIWKTPQRPIIKSSYGIKKNWKATERPKDKDVFN